MMRVEKVIGILNLLLISFFLLWCAGWLFTGAWYCNPNAEDLSLTSLPRDIGIIPATVDVMNHYDGRYFTNILHGINPLAFNWLSGYKLMPVFGFFFLITSFYFFADTLFVASRWLLLIFAGLFTMVHFATAPSLPHDLYWMVSAFVYLYPTAFTFLWVGSYIRYIHVPSDSRSVYWFLAAVISLFACIGLNEMFLVSNFVLLACIAVFAIASSDRSVLRKTIPVLLAGLGCIVFFVTSPGISDRAATQRDPTAGLLNVAGIMHAIADYRITGIYFLSNGIVIFSSLLVMLSFKSVSWRYAQLEQKYKAWMWGLVGLGLLAVSFLMTLAYYIPMQTNIGYPGRVFNSTVVPLQLIFFIVVPVLVFYYRTSPFLMGIWLYQKYLVFVFLSWLVSSTLFSNNNISRIRHEYNSGIMQQFDSTMQARYKAIYKAKQSGACWQVAAIDFGNPPNSAIYYGPDLGSNRNPVFWNMAYEIYFKLDEIKMQGDTALKLQ